MKQNTAQSYRQTNKDTHREKQCYDLRISYQPFGSSLNLDHFYIRAHNIITYFFFFGEEYNNVFGCDYKQIYMGRQFSARGQWFVLRW